MAERSVPARLRYQGEICAQMGSRLNAALLDRAAQDYEARGSVHVILAERQEFPRLGIRLMAALHYCALDGSAPELARHFPSTGGDDDADAAWSAARALMAAHPERINRLLGRTPQTNEVARSMVLLGGFFEISAHTHRYPLRLFEVGASAGLNLRFDAYRYKGDDWSWGDIASPVVLRNTVRSGRPQHLDATIEVVERRGCDLHPLDAISPRDQLELLSFVWADQTERFARLRAALDVASSVPVQIECRDAIVWLRDSVEARSGATTVIMHSVMADYLHASARAALYETIARIGATARMDAPIAWLRMELDGDAFETRVTLWPGGGETLVARSDGHAQNIVWTAAT